MRIQCACNSGETNTFMDVWITRVLKMHSPLKRNKNESIVDGWLMYSVPTLPDTKSIVIYMVTFRYYLNLAKEQVIPNATCAYWYCPALTSGPQMSANIHVAFISDIRYNNLHILILIWIDRHNRFDRWSVKFPVITYSFVVVCSIWPGRRHSCRISINIQISIQKVQNIFVAFYIFIGFLLCLLARVCLCILLSPFPSVFA